MSKGEDIQAKVNMLEQKLHRLQVEMNSIHQIGKTLSSELRTSMGVRSKLRAKSYSIERTADEYLKLYRALLSDNASRI